MLSQACVAKIDSRLHHLNLWKSLGEVCSLQNTDWCPIEFKLEVIGAECVGGDLLLRIGASLEITKSSYSHVDCVQAEATIARLQCLCRCCGCQHLVECHGPCSIVCHILPSGELLMLAKWLSVRIRVFED